MERKQFLSLGIICIGLTCVLWLGFAISPSPAAAQITAQSQPTTLLAQVVLTSTKDNTLYESPTGSVSSGAGPALFVGKTGSGSIRRGVIAFDLAGKIPATATITSVTLRLNVVKTIAGAHPVALHKVTADWGEGTSNAGGTNGGDGTAATTSDATWVHTFFSTQQWQTAGGDFAATASAAASVGGGGPYTWSSAEMIADVQSWLANPTSNFGWIVIGNEAASRTAKSFDTRESTTAANRPQLTIVYQSGTDNAVKVYLPQVWK